LTQSWRSSDRLKECTDDKIAESIAISNKKFDIIDYKVWRLEIEILLEQKQVIIIVNSTAEAPDAQDGTEFTAWKKQHEIPWSTILLAMERSLQRQNSVSEDTKASWDRLKEDYKSKVKLNVSPLQDNMSAAKLKDCENGQKSASKIQGYVNNFNLCAESSTGSIAKSGHSYYLMQGILKDNNWRLLTQLTYNKIDTLADNPEEIVTKIRGHEVRLQYEHNLEVAGMISKSQIKSEIRKSKYTWQFRQSCDTGSDSDHSSSDSEKHCCRHTDECDRYHKVRHIAWYCPSTAPVDGTAPPEPAAATTMTSIEKYWMTVTNKESSLKESWYVDCTTTSHICRNRHKSKLLGVFLYRCLWFLNHSMGTWQRNNLWAT
jgi:hypothetical protein